MRQLRITAGRGSFRCSARFVQKARQAASSLAHLSALVSERVHVHLLAHSITTHVIQYRGAAWLSLPSEPTSTSAGALQSSAILSSAATLPLHHSRSRPGARPLGCIRLSLMVHACARGRLERGGASSACPHGKRVAPAAVALLLPAPPKL